MNRQDFYIELVDYAETDILSKIQPGGLKWTLGAMLAAMPRLMDIYVTSNECLLKALGLLTADNDVDVEGIKTALVGAFRVQPSLTIKLDEVIQALIPQCMPAILDLLKVRVDFTKTDADKFLARLGVPQPETTP